MTEAPPPRRRHPWLRRLLAAGFFVLVVIGASPIWFPWLLDVAARQAGVTIGAYDRLGASRLRLSAVDAWVGPLHIHAGIVEIPQPLTWLQSVAGSQSTQGLKPAWLLRNWTLRVGVETNAADASAAPMDSIASVLNLVDEAGTGLRWLGGPVLAEAGRIELPDRVIEITTLEVTDRGVKVSAVESGGPVTLSLTRPGPGDLQARLDWDAWGIRLDSAAAKTGEAWRITGVLSRGAERLNIDATTQPGSWLPSTARIDGDPWTLPLPNPLQGSVQLLARADWIDRSGTFALEITGNLSPPGGSTPLPITVEIAGRLSPEAIQIDTLKGDWEFARAQLRRPVISSLREPWTLSPIDLEFEGRPEAVPAWGISGVVRGDLQSPESRPERLGHGLTFSITGEPLATQGVTIRQLVASGTVDWPRVHLERFEATTAEDARFIASAIADGALMELAQGHWTFEGRLPAILDSDAVAWPALSASGTAQGPFTNLLQSGEARSLAGLTFPPLHPVSLEARWRTRGRTAEELTVNAAQGSSGFRLQGRATFESIPTPLIRGEWTRLDFQTDGTNDLALTHPVPFLVRKSTAPDAPSGILVQIQNGRWQGQAGEVSASVDIDWPTQGRFDATLSELTPSFLFPWFSEVPSGVVGIVLHRIAVEAAWMEGPLDARIAMDTTIPVPEVGPLRIAGSVAVGADGVQLEHWTVTREGEAGPGFSARVPLILRPGESPSTGREGVETPLEGSLVIDEASWVWKWVAKRTGAEFVEPTARVDLRGTSSKPEVHLEWDVRQAGIQLPQTNLPPIRLEAISARAHASAESIVLDSLTLNVEGQELRATASLPWRVPGTHDGPTSLARWTPDLENLTGYVELPEANVSTLATNLGNFVQPGGILRGRVERRDAAWHGWLELTNVTTRPIAPVGSVRDIDLRLVWIDRAIQIERGQALVGGQPVHVSGLWPLPGHPNPEANLSLSGTNLALIRSTELLLRADIALTIARTNPLAIPVVGGSIRLRDSVVTMDVRDLVAVDLERPSQRPPFFSIEQPPLADWGLNVRVRGDRFARILSPVLRASASADLALLGTLRNPRLVGQAFVDRGRLAFPFGQLEIQQFRVLFTESDPYRPKLEGRAEGLSFGYNLGMDLGGTLAEPEITFTSTPPMTTSEVLQMLMAGSLPRNEYSYSTRGKAQNMGTYLASDLLTQLAGDPMEEPRLTFRSAQRVSSNGSLTYSVEYRLTDRWSAVAEYDRWNQIGAGVRWRVLEK